MASGVRDDLTSDVIIQYNGFTFPSNLDIIGFQTKGQLDRAGRTYKALRHTMTVRFRLNAFESADPQQNLENWNAVNIPTIRTQLMKVGAQLVLQNTSWGDVTINGNEKGLRDVEWGPRPESFEWKVWNKYGAEITWRITWQLNACDNQEQNTEFLEWNYGLSFVTDRLGYTTRTYKGSVSIPMTRRTVSDRTLVDQVDRLREKITPPIPIGFRRDGGGHFDLSDDKRTLQFAITDVEMPPNKPPAGVIIAEGSHNVRNAKARSFFQWHHTLRVKYEISNDRQASEAWEHFAKLFQQRIKPAVDNKMLVLPLELHLADPTIYGTNAAEISLTYAVMSPKNANPFLPNWVKQKLTNYIPTWIVSRSGLWTPTGDTWQNWATAMAKAKVSHPRGYAGMTFAANEDAIVDLCGGSIPTPVAATRQLKPPSIRVRSIMDERPIDPANSYLDYQMGLDVQPIDNTVVLDPLPTKAINYKPPLGVSDSAVGGYQQPYASGPPAIVQYRGSPRIFVTLWGRALRAGYDIPPPQLLRLWGQTPVPHNDRTCGFRSWVASNLLMPIVRAEWRFRYLLPALPQVPATAPPNPILGSTIQEAVSNPTLEGFTSL